MKIKTLAVALLILSVFNSKAQEIAPKKETRTSWKLIFKDTFNSKGSFNTKNWTYSPKGNPAWAKYLTPSSDYVFQNGSDLVLRMDNAKIDGDSAPYHSGGIQTSTKFSFLYGKVEVRAKFTQGQGSWPAIWMMPETPTAYGGWPKSGEIDIMEHVNNEKVMHQTIHNGKVTTSAGGSSATKTSDYNSTDYNIYGIIWSAEDIKFYVNNKLRYTYTKEANADSAQWPFDKPFYIILNQSGGLGWPGPIKDADLPFSMNVDWVKVYQEKKK